MRNIILFLFVISLSLFAQTDEPTAKTFDLPDGAGTLTKNQPNVFIHGFEMSQHESFDGLFPLITKFRFVEALFQLKLCFIPQKRGGSTKYFG